MDINRPVRCPLCKTSILANHGLTACPHCGTLYHTSCWERNNACTCPDCHNNRKRAGDACKNCNYQLGEGAFFCPACGTPKAKVEVCSACGGELEEEQAYCTKCGIKITCNKSESSYISDTHHQPASKKAKTKNNITFVVMGCFVIAFITVIAFIFFPLKPEEEVLNFNLLYPTKANEDWCTISQNGSFMKISTNQKKTSSHDWGADLSDVISIRQEIKKIATDLGFSEGIIRDILATEPGSVTRVEYCDKAMVIWQYPVSGGLEVSFKLTDED